MTGSRLTNYDDKNLTIEVNGVKVPVHIDASGVGYTPVRNMAAALGADVGWEDSGGGVSKVVMKQSETLPKPVTEQVDPEIEKLNQIIEQLLKEQQQPIPMPQFPQMPELPPRQPVSYETFLERAREMLNPAYARAREALSKVNEQLRQQMIQRLAGKGQPFGGLREELEMQLARDFMSQLSQQDLEQIEEAVKMAQSLSEQDEERARYIADEAWKRWQAQTQLMQQQYQWQAEQRNDRIAGLQTLAKYLQDQMESRRRAELDAQKFALDQEKFAWDKEKFFLPSGDTVYRYENIPASDLAQMELEWQKHQTPSGSALANAQAYIQGAAMRANAYNNNPSVTEIRARAAAIADGFTDQLLAYPDAQSMLLGVEQFIASNQADPYVAQALRDKAKYLADNFYYETTTDPFTGSLVKKPKAGPNYGKNGGVNNDWQSELTEVGDGTTLSQQPSWWDRVKDTIGIMHGF
ncbi:MAG: hypothetical protein K6T66_14380 [Peptococcaceae bacterium]|nr:hypothetical protein [Peptococcaceae bacterium]